MIHDILMALLNPSTSSLLINSFVLSEISSEFLHPAETKFLNDIIKIANQHKEIKKFVDLYGYNLHNDCNTNTSNKADENTLHKGLYLHAFANGINTVLESYRNKIVELEQKYLQKPSYTLMFLFNEIDSFQPLFHFLLNLITGVKTQQLHGCSILQYLQHHSFHGNKTILDAIRTIQKLVYVVFIKQMHQWLFYGKLLDTYEEFFIQHVEKKQNSSLSEKGLNVSPTTTHTATAMSALSENKSINTDCWEYEICFDLLPHYFNTHLAERVLFIGQSVLMFNSDPRNSNNATHDKRNRELRKYSTESIWGNKEPMFFKKFADLQRDEVIKISKFEDIIDEIKICVSEHLSDIAIKEADLFKQLKLIKDFYLLGRGELFFEFIKQTKSFGAKVFTESTIKELNIAFEKAGNSIHITDEIEMFSFDLPKGTSDSFSYETKGFINYITLNYKVKWPLHLLFSPAILDNYNNLFRFLLRIKRTQFDLHCVWSHHRETKLQRNSKVLRFRNKLMFLIDNLQYYLQVDVLESQFCILMAKIQDLNDFEQIQKAHTIFQANIMSLCFLLNSNNVKHSSVIPPSESPVLIILNKILHLTNSFCSLSLTCSAEPTPAEKQQFDSYENSYSGLVESLLKILIGLKAGPSSSPLSQLLLRLNFNYWFSAQNSKNSQEIN